MARKRVKRVCEWTIPVPPASYGAVDDSRLVRHVRVPVRSSLRGIKERILHAYEVNRRAPRTAGT